jgi:DNA-binding NarL/FixJ family response regulator
MTPLRVLIADDHALLVGSLSTALTALGIQVVAQVTDPHQVVAQTLAERPDVVVLDIRFGDQMPTGLDIARELLQRDPTTRIVFCSQYDTDGFIKEAYRIGGLAFITKSSPPETLATAIRSAAEGKTYWLPDVQERMAVIAVRGGDSPQAKLDERELQVLCYIAKGLTNVEIAQQMSLSVKTISNISQTIKDKLGVHRPADLALLAVKHRLVEP